MDRPPKLTARDGFFQGCDRRADPVVEVQHEQTATLLCCRNHALAFRKIGRQRLLAHHMLAGRQGRQDYRAVREIRRRDGDGLDLRVGEKFCQIGVGMAGAEARAHGLRAACIHIADGDELRFRQCRQHARMLAAPQARAHHCKAMLCHWRFSYPLSEPKVRPRTT